MDRKVCLHLNYSEYIMFIYLFTLLPLMCQRVAEMLL